MNALKSIGDFAIKAAGSFSAFGGQGYGGGFGYGGMGSNIGSSWNPRLPGADYDYHTAAGQLWNNPAAAACLVALADAFATADPILEQRVEGNDWEPVEHPIIDLLRVPNDDYSSKHLWGLTLISEKSQGAGFWRIVPDGAGRPRQLWFEPPPGVGSYTHIVPMWDEDKFISGYAHWKDGKEKKVLKKNEVVYFRHILNIQNPRLPWKYFANGAREVAALNSISTYNGATMRNGGAMAGVIAPDDEKTILTDDQAKDLKAKVRQNFTGENAGGWFVSNLRVKPHPLNFSPEQMAITNAARLPLSTVCALLRVPMDVALLNLGEHATYENLKQAMSWWWDNCIIPLEEAHGDEIETQLFPAFGLDRKEYRIGWDRSRVTALQDDWTSLWSTVGAAYERGVIDLDQAQVKLGYESKAENQGVYKNPSAPPPQPVEAEEPEDVAAVVVGQEEDEEVKTVRGWQTQPRDDHGKWTDGAGNLSASHVAMVMHAEGIVDKGAHQTVQQSIAGGLLKSRDEVLKVIDHLHAEGHSESKARAAVKKHSHKFQEMTQPLRDFTEQQREEGRVRVDEQIAEVNGNAVGHAVTATTEPKWKYEEYSDWARMLAKTTTVEDLQKKLGKLQGEQVRNAASRLSAIDKTTSMQSNSQARAQTGNVVRGNYEERNAIINALEIHKHYPQKAKGLK